LETLAVARSLALTGKFADPFAPMATGPTAHLAPVYPVALGLIVQRYGEGPSAVLAIKWMTLLLVALQAALLPALGRRMGLDYLPSLLAALAVVIGGYEALLWEANLAGLLLTLLAFPMYSFLKCKP